MDIVSDIIKVVNEVYKIYEQVKANKKRCARLNERLGALKPSLNRLTKEQCRSATDTLERTLKVVKDAHTLIQKFTMEKWYTRIYGAATGNTKDEFAVINERLQGCVQALNLAVSVELLFDPNKDVLDTQEDIKATQDLLRCLANEQGRTREDLLAIQIALDGVGIDIQNECMEIKEKQRQGLEGLEDIKELLLKALKFDQQRVQTQKPNLNSVMTLREIKFDEIIEGDFIGKGGFGEVRAGTWKNSPVALKKLTSIVADETTMQELRDEGIKHQKLNHPNIIAFFGACVEPSHACLVIELAPGGTLYRRIHKNPKLISAILALAYALDISAGLKHLHDCGIFHRDLKSLNVLIAAGGVLKLCDFGLAKMKTTASKTSNNSNRSLGTWAWMAPELHSRKAIKDWEKVDVYAFGMILYEIITREEPWAGFGVTEIITAVTLEDDRPVISASAKAEHPILTSMVEECWVQKRSERPSLKDGDIQRRIAAKLRELGGDPRRTVYDSTESLPSPPVVTAPIDLDIATIARRLGAATDSETRLNMALALHDACDNFDMPNKVTARVCGAIDPLVKMLSNGGHEAEVAAKTLWKVSREEDNQIAIANAGAIQPLIALLSSGTATAKENAAAALRNLAYNNANHKIAIANAGAIRPLIHLLSSGTATAKEYAAAALGCLAFNADNQIAIADAGAIRPLIDLLSSGTATAKENAAGALMNLAVNHNNEIAIANAGAIRPLIVLLSSGTATAKEYAAGALKNLAYNNDNNQIAIANAGAIQPLIALLSSGTAVAKEYAAVALWELAANANNQIAIADAGAIRPLIDLLSSGTATAKGNAAGALRNLAYNNDNKIAIASAGAIRPLIALLSSGTAAKENAADALGNLAFDNDNNRIAIANAGAIRPLIDLLSSGTATAKENAAAALFFLADDANNQIAIANAGAIRPLIDLLSSGTATAKEKAAAALWSLAVDNANNQIAIANAGAIRPLIDLLSTGAATAKEIAAGTLANLAANANNRIAIANAGAIQPLITLANSGNTTSEEALKSLARNNNVEKMIKNNGGSAFLK